jgi:hypothetical protein
MQADTGRAEPVQTRNSERTPSKRDHRIDLLRGIALASIFINHMPGNWLEKWTTRNFGFSDAAEAFVLLAGYAAALAFFPRFLTGETWAVTVKAFRRAGVLYGAHIATTLVAILQFWLYASVSGSPEALELIGVAPIFTDIPAFSGGILMGGFQLGYFNILPLYVVLLALLPVMLWLAKRDLRLLAAASAAVYVAANAWGVSLPEYPIGGSWFFNPLAWQAIFVAGLMLGVGTVQGRTVPYHPAAFLAAFGYVAFGLVWIVGNLGLIAEGYLPDAVTTMHKTNAPLLRVLHVLSLAYVLCHSRVWGWLARVPSGFMLTRMGRHSLPVFAVGSLLSMAGWIVLLQTEADRIGQTAVVAAGLAVMGALAVWLDGNKTRRAPMRVEPEVAGTLRRDTFFAGMPFGH